MPLLGPNIFHCKWTVSIPIGCYKKSTYIFKKQNKWNSSFLCFQLVEAVEGRREFGLSVPPGQPYNCCWWWACTVRKKSGYLNRKLATPHISLVSLQHMTVNYPCASWTDSKFNSLFPLPSAPKGGGVGGWVETNQSDVKPLQIKLPEDLLLMG